MTRTVPCKICNEPVKVRRQRKDRRILTTTCADCKRDRKKIYYADSMIDNPLHQERLANHIRRMESIMKAAERLNIDIGSANAVDVDRQLATSISLNKQQGSSHA